MGGLGVEGFGEARAAAAASMPNRRILFRVYASLIYMARHSVTRAAPRPGWYYQPICISFTSPYTFVGRRYWTILHPPSNLVVLSLSYAKHLNQMWLVWNKHFNWRIWASLIPIVGGILLTSMTELSFNVFGFCAVLFGCLATSTRTILAESLLHGFQLDSINTVYYMAPFATMILAIPAIVLEGSGMELLPLVNDKLDDKFWMHMVSHSLALGS